MGQQSIISRVQTCRSDSLGGASSLGLFELVPPLVTAGASVCVSQCQRVRMCRCAYRKKETEELRIKEEERRHITHHTDNTHFS